ncbi:MAG: alkaline phosphatase [Phycisphaerales bacterium]|nr:MAG: alkaline phosphatase [Phycisphaerales bacterium]
MKECLLRAEEVDAEVVKCRLRGESFGKAENAKRNCLSTTYAAVIWLACIPGMAGAIPTNVVLFIGDGMGPEQVRAAGMYANGAEGTLSFETFPNRAELTTYSASSSITDSAAAATAMATGVKVNNGVISRAYPGDGSELQTLLEYSKAQGKSTGLVTTTFMTHATPAAFGAHESSRANYSEIADDYLTQTRPNILFGGSSYMSAAAAAGYAVVADSASMVALDTEVETMVSGQFSSGNMTYEYDRTAGTTEPHLSEMTETALKILDNDADGFFLMVEGGRIDHASHNNDIVRTVQETVEFGNAVQAAIDWVTDTASTDTLILVTADHETGGLTVQANNGKGAYPDVSWSTTGHTGVNVPIYAWGSNGELILGVMDNTDVFWALFSVFAFGFDHPGIGVTENQRALGVALQQIADAGGNSVTTALMDLESIDQARSAYDQLCGQSRAGLTPVTVASTARFMGTVSDRVRSPGSGMAYGFNSGPLLATAGPDSTLGDASTSDVSPDSYMFALGNGTRHFSDQRWGIWGKGYGVFGDRKREGGVPGYQYTVYGGGFGLDYQFTERLLFGVTGGYSSGDVGYFSLRDSSSVKGTHAGLYGRLDRGDWYIDSVLTYTDLDYETLRYVDVMDERLQGEFGGQGLSGYFEAGSNWRRCRSFLIQPLASFQFCSLSLDGYTESGGSSALSYGGQSYESYKGSLGARVRRGLCRGAEGCSSAVEFRGRWVHEFGDTSSGVDAHFASDPGVVFTVSDAGVSRDSAVLGVGFDAELGGRTWLSIDYDASLSADSTINVFSAALEHRW